MSAYDEQDLLARRAKYPEASGWETARAWIFRPSQDEQVRMGIERVLERDLIAEFLQRVVHEEDIPSRQTPEQHINWDSYRANFVRIRNACDHALLAKLLWAIFTWTKAQPITERARYLKEAVGSSADLATILGHNGVLEPFLSAILSREDPHGSLTLLKQTFEGIEHDPKATAVLVLDFIYAVRDIADNDAVLSAFFDGFELKANYGIGRDIGASITWNASPMLKAIANVKGRPIVQLYENFLRHVFTTARAANAQDWPTWQRAYDGEFLLWTNVIQSGMFNPKRAFEYGET